MIKIEWDMLILLHGCLSNSPEKFRTIIFLYTLYISLVLTLWYLLSLGHYLLRVIYFGHMRLIWCIYRWWTPGGTTKEARTCRRHPLSLWSNWWWCKLNCFSRWPKLWRIMGMEMGMHPLKSDKRGESFWRDIRLSSSIPLTHSKLMTGYVQLRGNLRLHSVMTKRRFCMLLDSYKGLHLTGGTLSTLAILKLIPSLGKSFAVPSALIMCLLGWWSWKRRNFLLSSRGACLLQSIMTSSYNCHGTHLLRWMMMRRDRSYSWKV